MDMSKPSFTRPTLMLLYGFPGAGKTFFARQLCDSLSAAHVHGDRIRYELFEQPRNNAHENEIVNHLMEYMAEEFLRSGTSVVFDANAMRPGQRRALRELARKHKAEPLLVWVQIDTESAFTRVAKRDRRRIDDKYTEPMDRTTFDDLVGHMKNPALTEDYVVISGKHNFKTQQHMVLKKLYDLGLFDINTASIKLAKPELVNRVPNPLAGRVDPSRRNIVIR
jgi:predicted kinase